MVDVGMTQNHHIDAFRVKGKGLPVARFVLPATLNESAVEQEPMVSHLQQMAGTGHLTGCSEELNL